MSYTPISWKDYPDKTTPVSAANLNHMEEGIVNNDAEISEIKENMEFVSESIETIGNDLESQAEQIEEMSKSLGSNIVHKINMYEKRAELAINFAGASTDTTGEIAKYCDEYFVSTWPTANQTITDSGLDFSKYDYITIALVNTGSYNDIFDMKTIPVAALKATGTNFLVTHGNASAYGYVYFKYVSDTSFAVKRTGSTTSNVKIIGWLKPENVEG